MPRLRCFGLVDLKTGIPGTAGSGPRSYYPRPAAFTPPRAMWGSSGRLAEYKLLMPGVLNVNGAVLKASGVPSP